MDRAQEGKRVDRWLSIAAPALPMGLRQKYLRLKRVKVNGRPAKGEDRLHAGDVVNVFIGDEFFTEPRREDRFLSGFHWHLNILYEDESILLVDKQPGLVVHPDGEEKVDTLLHHVQAYLYQRGGWDSQDPAHFAPVLCNRIDRFTGGIVIAARTEPAMKAMNGLIRDNKVDKFYLAIVHGSPRHGEGTLTHYLQHAGKRMRALSHPEEGAQRAQTEYKVLGEASGLSLVECRLLTGRTHQIRAQFAAIGHPLLGDGQYGDSRKDERYGRRFQALYAYKIAFPEMEEGSPLARLSARAFTVKQVPFVGEYFHMEYDGKEVLTR